MREKLFAMREIGERFAEKGYSLVLTAASSIRRRPTITMMMVVLLLYAIVGAFLFSPIVDNILRSDYWFIRVLFGNTGWSSEDIKGVATFELLGNPRSQPLAHLLLFARYTLFGDNIALYHILSIALHVTNGFLVFLILSRLNTRFSLSAIFGLLFIVLTSQFDTAVWTYHVYLVLGTSLFLLALLLVIRYIQLGRAIYFYSGVFLALLLALLYEAAILAPAILLLIVWVKYALSGEEEKGSKQRLRPLLYSVLASYLVFFLVSFYMFQITKTERDVSLVTDTLIGGNLIAATKAVGLGLWESVFIKNIGIRPDIQFLDIIYLRLPNNIFTDWTNLFKLLLGLCLIPFFRLRKQNAFLVLPLLVLALSYMFILSAGRLTTNTLEYVLTQPRHFYFPNCMVMISIGLLLGQKYERKHLRYAIAVILIAISIFNAQSVWYSNKEVARMLSPINQQYYSMQSFFKANPSAKLFLDFVPDNRRKLCLGLDVAFDALYQGSNRITKSVKEATHIYDSREFRVNEKYSPASIGPYLGDFTVQWQFWVNPASPLRHEVAVIGSDALYPRIAITPDQFIQVDMVNSTTGKIDQFRLKLPPWEELWQELPQSGGWPVVIIEKEGDELCFIVNGTLRKKVHLNHSYLRWDKDGIELLGEVYQGAHEMMFSTRLFVELDGAKYSSGAHNVGDRLTITLFRPW